MTENLMETFENQHNEFLTESANDRIEKELSYYESFIPEFFSKNGEAEGIRNMYESIRLQIGENEKKISCTDIHNAGELYKEYLEGMSAFINDLKSASMTDDNKDTILKQYEEQVNRALNGDQSFITSLYAENTKTDTVLSEAVQNVEYLIDFIPYIKDLKNQCTMMKESMPDDDSLQSQLINSTIGLMFESVDRFTYATIKEIMSTYTNLNNSLNGQVAEEDHFVLI